MKEVKIASQLAAGLLGHFLASCFIEFTTKRGKVRDWEYTFVIDNNDNDKEIDSLLESFGTFD